MSNAIQVDMSGAPLEERVEKVGQALPSLTPNVGELVPYLMGDDFLKALTEINPITQDGRVQISKSITAGSNIIYKATGDLKKVQDFYTKSAMLQVSSSKAKHKYYFAENKSGRKAFRY